MQKSAKNQSYFFTIHFFYTHFFKIKVVFAHKKHCNVQLAESRTAYRKEFFKQISESGAIQCTYDILFS